MLFCKIITFQFFFDMCVMNSLAHRDMQLLKLEEEIKLKKDYLLKKRKELDSKIEMNEHLTEVKENYNKYHSYIVREKEEQRRALTLLQEYVSDLIKTEKVMDHDLREAKQDSSNIEHELKRITSELDELIGEKPSAPEVQIHKTPDSPDFQTPAPEPNFNMMQDKHHSKDEQRMNNQMGDTFNHLK